MPSLTIELKAALCAAGKAAKIIRRGFSQGFSTDVKADDSLVTSIDKAAEAEIIRILQKRTRHAVLSEESGALPGDTNLTWVIDPLDGTANFARRLQPFAVSIALMQGDKSLLGVIQNPMTGERCYAVKGGGAFYNARKIHTATNRSRNTSIVFFNYGYNEQDKKRIGPVVDCLIQDFGVRTWGTTAWELCAVARGTADAFVCIGDKLWDFAAGMCIVQEAGGLFSDWCGRPWDDSHSFILAAQPDIQPMIVQKIQHVQENGL